MRTTQKTPYYRKRNEERQIPCIRCQWWFKDKHALAIHNGHKHNVKQPREEFVPMKNTRDHILDLINDPHYMAFDHWITVNQLGNDLEILIETTDDPSHLSGRPSDSIIRNSLNRLVEDGHLEVKKRYRNRLLNVGYGWRRKKLDDDE